MTTGGELETIIIRGLDGTIIEAYKRCKVCGADQFWGDRCVYVEFTGRHRGIQEPAHSRKKYRKTPRSQVDLFGNNLREMFWGPRV